MKAIRKMPTRILVVWVLALALLLPSSHAFSSTLRSPVGETLVDNFEAKELSISQNKNNSLPSAGLASRSSSTSPIDNGSNLYLQEQRKHVFVGLLSAYYAFADVYCFKTFDCFASMNSGNLIRCCLSVVDGHWQQAFLRGSLVVNYILGSMLYKFIKSHDNKLTVGPVMLTLFGASDVVGRLVGQEYSPFLMALAFGIINADNMVQTGVVVNAATGHMSKLGQGVGDAILSRKSLPRATMIFFASFVPSLLLFGLFFRVQSSLPIGTVLGVTYWLLLRWYESPVIGSFWSSWVPTRKRRKRV